MCVGSTVTPLAVMQVKINQFPFCSYLLGTLSHVLASLTQTQLLSDMLSECHHSRENEQRLICHDFFFILFGDSPYDKGDITGKGKYELVDPCPPAN